MTDGRTDGQTDGQTDGRTDGQTDGGDCNIPNAFLKKRGDKNRLFSCIGCALKKHSKHYHVTIISSRTLTAPLISGVEPFVKF